MERTRTRGRGTGRRLRWLALALVVLALWPAASSAADWQVRVDEPTGGGRVELRTEVPAVDYDSGRMWFPNGAFVDWSVPYVYWAWNPQVPFCPGACTFDFPSTYVHPLLGGPPYPNRRVFLIAVPDPGWYVSSWSGLCAGGGTQCEIPLGQSGLAAVSFSRCPPGESCLTVRSGPAGLGTLTVRTGSVGGPVVGTCNTLCTYAMPAGTTAVVTGAAPGGAVVGAWTGCTAGPSDRCTVTVNGDTRLEARFQYPVTISQPSPFMAVGVEGPEGYLGMCDGSQPSCTYLVDPGGRVRMHRFVSIPSLDMNYRWTASWAACTPDVDGSACTADVVGPLTVQARYVGEVRLQVDTPTHARITSSPAGIDCGTGSPGTCAAWLPLDAFVDLHAVADTGWTVAGWQTGECISLTADCTVELDEPPLPSRVTTYAQVRVNVVGAGQVDAGGAGIPCPAVAPSICFAAPASPSVQITRNPRPSSVFDGWSGGGCSGTGVCNVVADGPKTITASFTGYYPLYASSDSLGSVQVSSSIPAHHCTSGICFYAGGTVVTLTEVPNNPWAFQDWTSDSGACTGTRHVCVIVMGQVVNAQGEVRAHASHWAGNLITTTITGQGAVESNPSGLECTGPVVGCADYVLGGNGRRFEATPAPGWSLTGWTGVCSGTANPCVTNLSTSTANLGATFADVTAPIATFVSRTPAAAGGWNTGAVTVTWSCADVGTGVVAATVSDTVGTDGADQTAAATCEDGAGNQTPVTLADVDVDAGQPQVTGTPSRAPDANGWYRAPFAVAWSATATSGIAACDATTLYTGPAAATGTLEGDCTSNAGASGQGSLAFKYDPAPPTLTAPDVTVAAATPAGAVLAAYPGVTASDALSGVTVACEPAAPHLFAVGTTTVACRATDGAGNETVRALEVTVTAEPDLTLAATPSALQQGGEGTLTLTVGNAGTGPTAGAVAVTATIPPGLSVRGAAGAGWTCDAATAACARSDALAPGAAYPPVTVTLAAALDAPDTAVVGALVNGGDAAAATYTIARAPVAPPVSPPATTPEAEPKAKPPLPLSVKATARVEAGTKTLVVRTTLTRRSRVVLTLRTRTGRTVRAWTRTVAAGTATLRLALPARTVPRGSRLAVVATAGTATAKATVAVG